MYAILLCRIIRIAIFRDFGRKIFFSEKYNTNPTKKKAKYNIYTKKFYNYTTCRRSPLLQ